MSWDNVKPPQGAASAWPTTVVAPTPGTMPQERPALDWQAVNPPQYPKPEGGPTDAGGVPAFLARPGVKLDDAIPLPPPCDVIEKPLSAMTVFLFDSYKGDIGQLTWMWNLSAQELATVKDRETRLRIAAYELNFRHPREGTNNLELPDGYILKAVNKTNYNLAEVKLVDAALEEIESCGQEGKFIAERLVKWKPELDMKEYKALKDDQESPTRRKMLAAIDRVITTKPGMPALTLEKAK